MSCRSSERREKKFRAVDSSATEKRNHSEVVGFISL
jgi:hypothetical protein